MVNREKSSIKLTNYLARSNDKDCIGPHKSEWTNSKSFVFLLVL